MLVSSELMIAECLRGPLKTGHTARVAEYRNMFARPDDLRLLPITRAISEASTLIAAKTGAKLFDAIHLATAVAAGCDAFVTNDKGIHHPEGLKLLRFWADFPRQ